MSGIMRAFMIGAPSFLLWLLPYKYVLTFVLAIVEGPVIMTISGFFLKLGHFEFWPLYLTLMAGDLAADAIWYAVGYFGAHPLVKKYGRYFNITEELVLKTEAAFHKHQNKILFLSKITMGLGFALVILITAGIAKVPFKKYLAFNAVGQFFWTGFLMFIGYSFGNLYLVINEGLQTASLIAFVIIVAAAFWGISRYLKKKDLERRL
ncbi:DedA family protein [Candidatus Parcubacteria bacterium]|nr:MAG: DedA family protein [Candidatus Parcubacteria bacterium]